jgi:hypothetical protein
MLIKAPEDRPSIGQVKAHRWLSDQPPIRDTLTQSLEIRPLKNIEETPNKGYVVISKHTDSTPQRAKSRRPRQSTLIAGLAERSARLSEAKFNEAIWSLKENTEGLMQEAASAETAVVAGRELVDSLSLQISEKTRANRQLGQVERELLESITMLNVEFEKLCHIDSTPVLTEELRQVQQSIFECQFDFTRKQALHTSHFQELKRKAEQVKDLELQLSALTSQRQALKNELKNYEKEPKTTVLNLQAGIMRTRLANFGRLSQPLSSSDALIAESIADVGRSTSRGLNQREIMEQVEALEDRVRQVHNQISQTSFEYEEEKSKNLALLRTKHEEVMASATSLKLQQEVSALKETAAEKATLQQQIEAYLQLPRADLNELQALRQKTAELQLSSQQEEERVGELYRRREALRQQTELSCKEIESTENELGLLKGKVYAIALSDM